eukprot:TRINITY_DN9420_c0_g1_i2.p11 TRINITY_DN9420_c0_g1~~TRINITY_DN9420_c0_g1_i2.p11  ORF type:complete len:137 (+),score=4.37 TRINITY_DN9420_c0_g1_i2:1347-1757(+)
MRCKRFNNFPVQNVSEQKGGAYNLISLVLICKIEKYAGKINYSNLNKVLVDSICVPGMTLYDLHFEYCFQEFPYHSERGKQQLHYLFEKLFSVSDRIPHVQIYPSRDFSITDFSFDQLHKFVDEVKGKFIKNMQLD